ncbi:hypothetical protein GOP47_0006423 [Adiantum capillus-veneris]|uniref:DNA replication licensing factor MCM3 n=1 Tax=Adiantum capillus-veneris TaxID=13818 RepID=A0A9D4V3N0_ADICA|nr:hypothetical protein GOP47_0006423 [Adiantum capillus-veneris]
MKVLAGIIFPPFPSCLFFPPFSYSPVSCNHSSVLLHRNDRSVLVVRPVDIAAPTILVTFRQAGMDVNQEAQLAHKRTFMDFLDQDIGQGIYMDKIRSMIAQGRHRLFVDLADLRNFNTDLARRLIRHPSEYLQPFADALDEVTRSIDPKYLQEEEDVQVGFEGHFGFHKLSPRELLAPFIGSLVCVEGIVTKCSLVRPKVVKSVHFCPSTGDFTSREYRDITSNTGLPTGSVYPTRDDLGNLLVTEFGLCKYRDHQTISIQEMPENSAPGQLPRSIDVVVEDDLVDVCKPGDRIIVVGIYKAVAGKTKGSVNGVFRTIVVANNIAQLNKEINTPIFTNEDIKNIKKIGNRQDAFDLLGESLAPSICGHSWIKKAVVLQLLGGVEKNLKNGTHIRGDINMMMVGDPSVAKSQLLRAIMNIAPLAISTTGRGSSGVGLTAAVTTDQETGERRLEAGAMVLADRGVVCIDEFDKMNDLDRVAIHEVMEQQTVTIAKAGIHASLNARCSVVAAANPIYGTYDRSITPTKNIGLPDSLLSRFDLLFIVLDQMDADIDRQISEHVLRMHRYRSPSESGGLLIMEGASRSVEDEEAEVATAIFVKYNRLLHGERRVRQGKRETLTIKFLKKYIHYAKSRHQPVLSDEASEQIASAYAEMRNASAENKSGGGTLPITARTLETIIRLSTAHAKLKLRNQVLKADVDAALKVLNFAVYHKELTDMEHREQERERELERKRQAEGDAGEDGDASGAVAAEERQTPRRQRRRSNADSPSRRTSGDVDERDDDLPTNGSAQMVNVAPERQERFHAAFSQHMMSNRLDQIAVSAVAAAVNAGNPNPFSREEVDWLLQRLHTANRVMVAGDTVHLV